VSGRVVTSSESFMYGSQCEIRVSASVLKKDLARNVSFAGSGFVSLQRSGAPGIRRALLRVIG
jgi:hypothetical protein